MTRENLARKFRPAGFEQPEGSRQNYVKPRRELQEFFYQWIDEYPDFVDEQYNNHISHTDNILQRFARWLRFTLKTQREQYDKACELIQPLAEVGYREANSLLADFKVKLKNHRNAGLFLSACYNQSPEQIITFDFNAPNIDLIGYRLEENKFLLNRSEAGNELGSNSYGIVFNDGKCGDQFGFQTSGIVINNGLTGESFGKDSEIPSDDTPGGIAIAIQEPKGYGDTVTRLILRPTNIEKNPKLKTCLEELCDLTKAIKDGESEKRFLERYGSNPKKGIEEEIMGTLTKLEILKIRHKRD